MSDYLTPMETAQLLKVSEGTLRQWRWLGRGPAFTKAGRRVLYDRRDLEAWLASHRVDPKLGGAGGL